MAFDLPFYLPNTHVNITILVVDDDPIFLSVIPTMLKNPTYKDKSFGEITVMTANNSSEAISTLRGQCNNIDVVITDYHMPGLNGVQLKKRIDEEFGNLPVIVMSADMNNEIEQETLSSGATCFMRKPIKPNDLNIICEHALNYKMNDGSKKIQETNSTSNSYDGDSPPEDSPPQEDPPEEDQPQASTKSKIKWTRTLENLFYKAIQHLGVHKATPKKILDFMQVKDLTRAHVASKLQKYRKFLKEVKDEGIERARRSMNSNFTPSGYINPQHSHNYNTSLRNNNLFNSQPGYGLGQSSPMMNKNAGLHDSVNYMNRRPTNNLSQTGSSFLPTKGSLGFSNGMLPLKEENRSISGTSQEAKAPSFGQYGTTSDVLGMNSNLTTGTTGSNYAGIRINEIGDLTRLGGIRVHGNGNGNDSLGGIRVHCNGNSNGSLGGIRVHGNGNGNGSHGGIRVHGNGNSSLGGIRVHGNGNGNGSLGGIRVHGNGNGNGSHGGIRVHGNGNGSLGGIRVHGNGNGNGRSHGGIRVHGNDNGSLGETRVRDSGNGNGSLDGIMVHNNDNGNGSLGGIRVHGNGIGNGSLGENLGGMKWISSNFPSALSSFLDNKDQSQNNLFSQTNDVVPVIENPRIVNDHHDINEVFCDTINLQFDHNQHQGKVTGENLGVSNAYPLEDISNWSFNNGNCNEETLNPIAANAEMYFPTPDMNITNQEHGVTDSTKFPLSFDQDSCDDDFLDSLLNPDMN